MSTVSDQHVKLLIACILYDIILSLFFSCAYSKTEWDEWAKVSSMIKTKNEQRVKSYAMKLEAKCPELVKYFTKKSRVESLGQNGKRKKKWTHSKKSNRGTNLSHVRNNNASVSTRSLTKFAGTGRITTKPNVVICLGDYVIDTEAEPWVLRPSSERKRPAECLPQCFDPSIRPTIPTSIQQIFIPGNHVYARWMDKNDPGSYGTVSQVAELIVFFPSCSKAYTSLFSILLVVSGNYSFI